MTLAEEREELKARINHLQASVQPSAGEQHWQPVLDEIQQVRDCLERTYVSAPRWWAISLSRALASLYFRCLPARSLPTARRIDPLGPSAVMLALADKIRTCDRERIELTPANLSDWLDDQTTRTPGFDPMRCFRTLQHAVRHGYAQVMGGTGRCSYFLDAPSPDCILISAIVRWPEPLVGIGTRG